jgi:hypothetical protein
LNPIKRKYIVELTSTQLNIPTEVVEDITSFFYQTLQKRLSRAEDHSIFVPNLGTFVVKRKSLEEKILKNQNFVNKIEKDEYISVQTYQLILDKRIEIENLKKLEASMDLEYQRKLQVREKKQIYRDGKLNQNLEGSKQDPGRNKE